MDNINVQNGQGKTININVVRYFRLNGSEYLIFSLNEVDEGGYVKLYICKVVDNKASAITDDVEWNLIKDTIKTIIKSNKDNLPLPIVDINSQKLSGIQIIDQKVFKLGETFINLLGANKKIEVDVIDQTVQPIESIAPDQSTQQFDTSVIGTPSDVLNQEDIIDNVQSFEGPSLEVPSGDSQDIVENNKVSQINSDTVQTSESTIPDGMSDYALNYKTLYENELNKNKDLVEINQKYQNIINNLKNIIEEAL